MDLAGEGRMTGQVECRYDIWEINHDKRDSNDPDRSLRNELPALSGLRTGQTGLPRLLGAMTKIKSKSCVSCRIKNCGEAGARPG